MDAEHEPPFGIPYSLSELTLVARTREMDGYHRALMKWAADEIERLQRHVSWQDQGHGVNADHVDYSER